MLVGFRRARSRCPFQHMRCSASSRTRRRGVGARCLTPAVLTPADACRHAHQEPTHHKLRCLFHGILRGIGQLRDLGLVSRRPHVCVARLTGFEIGRVQVGTSLYRCSQRGFQCLCKLSLNIDLHKKSHDGIADVKPRPAYIMSPFSYKTW